MSEKIINTANMEYTGEEIIRCKDCRFSVKNATYCNISGIDWQDAEPNGFCAWAERKES